MNAERLKAAEAMLSDQGLSPRMIEQDVWDWLQRLALEFETLRLSNAKLMARVQEFERLTHGATALSDDELLAELPPRMVRALRSSQDVAEEIVRRARGRGTQTLREAENEADEILRKAHRDAADALREGTAAAEACVDEAWARAEEMVAEATAARDRVLADLDARRAEVGRELRSLHAVRGQLLEALSSVKATLEKPPSEEASGHARARPNRRSGTTKTTALDWRRRPSSQGPPPRQQRIRQGRPDNE